MERLGDWASDNRGTAAALGLAAGGVLGLYLYKSSGYRRKPSSFELTGGAVDASKVKATVSAREPPNEPAIEPGSRWAARRTAITPHGTVRQGCRVGGGGGGSLHLLSAVPSLLLIAAGGRVLWRVQHPGARQGRGAEGVAEGALLRCCRRTCACELIARCLPAMPML